MLTKIKNRTIKTRRASYHIKDANLDVDNRRQVKSQAGNSENPLMTRYSVDSDIILEDSSVSSEKAYLLTKPEIIIDNNNKALTEKICITE